MPKGETPYIETEVFLAILDGDDKHFYDLLDQLSPYARDTLLGQVRLLEQRLVRYGAKSTNDPRKKEEDWSRD